MKLILAPLLLPALCATLVLEGQVFAQASATTTVRAQEGVPGLLTFDGPASTSGVIVIGRSGPGGEFQALARFPFVTDRAGHGAVQLTAAARQPGALVSTVYPAVALDLPRITQALPLAPEHVLPAAGQLEIRSVRAGIVELENMTNLAIPLSGSKITTATGQAAVLPAGVTVPPGARFTIAIDTGAQASSQADVTAIALTAFSSLGEVAVELTDRAGHTIDSWSPLAASSVPGSTLSAASLPGGSSKGATARVEDLPDASYLDTNGDGIDGDLVRALFVDATTGSPAGDGSPKFPLNSIQDAIDLAVSLPTKDHVYVSRGIYWSTDALDLADGISVWGGFDAAKGWRRRATNLTTISPINAATQGMVGVRAFDLTQPMTLGDVTITTPILAPAGKHNYGIIAYRADALQLDRVIVLTGAGRPGVAGAVLTNTSAPNGGGGGAGGGAGTFAGKKGGTGGTSSIGGKTGGGGGNGGTSGGNGKTGGVGKLGINGNTGLVANNFASVSGNVLVVNGNGTSGTRGGSGSGGGGGGGGSGGIFKKGGGGGAGGKAGRGGSYGLAGTGGGSSIGLLLRDSEVTLNGGSFTAGDGGQGGNGGSGFGGLNGSGGSNGSAPSGAGDGGKGGTGGKGGAGGGGAGGGGGSSFGIVIGPGSTLQVNGASVANGTAGSGGSAANSPTGLPGQAATIIQL